MNALEMVCLFTGGFALGFLFCAIINGALKSAAHAPHESHAPLNDRQRELLARWKVQDAQDAPTHANYKARCDAQRWADFSAVESHGQRLARLKGGK